MNRRLSVLLHLAVALSLAQSAAVAQTAGEEAPAAVIRFPRGMPRELATVFSATAPDKQAATFRIRAAGCEPPDIMAQRETGSTRMWFIASLQDPELPAMTQRLPAAPPGATQRDAKQIVSIREVAGGLQVRDAGRPVLVYATTPQSQDGKFVRNGFVHPLYGLDGEKLTQAFPADHRHHHGVFWAWHQLWVGDLRAGDPWVTEDFLAELQEAQVIDQGPVFGALRARLHWTSPQVVDENGQLRAIVEETTTIRVFHATESAQLIDFEIRLQPLLDDVRLGGAENERGYSGFTIRVRPPRKMAILAESGALARDAVGTQSRWADVTGQFSAGAALSGIAILAHRELREFPPRWLLRFYGMQNVVYPGREPVRLSAESPLVLRHRLVIHRGDTAAARIADQQRAYELGP